MNLIYWLSVGISRGTYIASHYKAIIGLLKAYGSFPTKGSQTRLWLYIIDYTRTFRWYDKLLDIEMLDSK